MLEEPFICIIIIKFITTLSVAIIAVEVGLRLGRQQWVILDNGGNSDPVILCV